VIHGELHDSDEGFHDMGPAACEAETKKAVCVAVRNMGGKTWIPKSALHDNSEVYKKGDSGKLVVHVWWAKLRGLVAP
jgi:hypothetical protein